ncbi:MAG: NmrA family NAD(P)-binding protein [Bacteroidetes bacterium]|nr:NmrA family NAD(P)-binding protein [Bacteroidota bacterium]
MKIVVTGSLGHISKPLTIDLIKKGHSVTVISSNPKKQKNIKALGASAAIGSIADVQFLATTFTGADAIYCMEPPVNFFDPNLNLIEYYNQLGNNYKQAILQSGVKRVIHLSSIGAHTDKNNGILIFHFNVENIFRNLPDNVAIVFLRPVGFYYNLLGFIPTIKTRGLIATNYNAKYKEPWVSPIDIAAVAAEEITKNFEGKKIRYVASDELTSDEIASILGKAISKPDLKWTAISDEQQLNNLVAAGMNSQSAKGLVEMNAARHTGELFEDYYRNRPVLGKIKLTDFANEFAECYHQK